MGACAFDVVCFGTLVTVHYEKDKIRRKKHQAVGLGMGHPRMILQGQGQFIPSAGLNLCGQLLHAHVQGQNNLQLQPSKLHQPDSAELLASLVR